MYFTDWSVKCEKIILRRIELLAAFEFISIYLQVLRIHDIEYRNELEIGFKRFDLNIIWLLKIK